MTYDNGSNSYTHPVELVVSAAHLTVSAGPVGPAPPLATNDTATTAFNTAVTIQVLTNDSDPNGDALSITSITQGAHGAVTLNGGITVTYTPTEGYSGADSFTYTISDGNGGTSTATVKSDRQRRHHRILYHGHPGSHRIQRHTGCRCG